MTLFFTSTAKVSIQVTYDVTRFIHPDRFLITVINMQAGYLIPTTLLD